MSESMNTGTMRELHDAELSRRGFVRMTTLAAGGLVGGLIAPSAWAMQAERAAGVGGVKGGGTLKVGLIGCGGRGTGAAIQALSADAAVVLHAMADAFEERMASCVGHIKAEFESRAADEAAGAQNGAATRKALERIDVPKDRQFAGFDGYQKVIACCDVVLLCTPPHFRPMHLKAAVEAGRHVFCEKPVAVDSPGVRSVLETVAQAKAKRLSIVCGFCWRYSAKERETYRRILEGGIGDVRAVYSTYNAGGWITPRKREAQWTEMEYQMRNWHFFPWLSGDHIVEQAVHSIDKMAWVMNQQMPTVCWAVGGRQVRDKLGEPGSVWDHFGVTYEYANGARGFHMCRHTPNAPFDNSDYVMGAKGNAVIFGWTPEHRFTGENEWTCTTAANDMYQQEHDELFAAIRSGAPINDGEWMTHSTLMAIMARQAAYTGQAVTWDQAMNSKESLIPSAYEWGGEPPTYEVAVPGFTKFV